MNIVYHSTDSFAKITAVSMTSLFENNKWADVIDVYYIENSISEENKELLKSIAERYCRNIHFIKMPDIEKDLQLKVIKFPKWHNDSYCRLFLDVILPSDIERVLYLDCDTIIVDSLKELWEMDLNGKCIAAVGDCVSKAYYETLGILEDDLYINDGVLLIDITKWKEKNMGEIARNYIDAHKGFVFFVEQTVFSAISKNELFRLNPEYNSYTLIQALEYSEIINLRCPYKFYSENIIDVAKNKPVIVHLTGLFLIRKRAWENGSDHPMAKEFEKYMDIAIPNAKFESATSLKKAMMAFAVYICPRKLLIKVVSIIYNKVRVNHIRKMIANHE